MYIDVIEYELADGITEAMLQVAAADILETWMKQQPGFISWDINKKESGYMDFVYWENKAAADAATQNMSDIPPDHAWLACYKPNSISTTKLTPVASYKN